MASNHASAGYPTGSGGSGGERTHSPIGDQVGMAPLGGKHPDIPKPKSPLLPMLPRAPGPPPWGAEAHGAGGIPSLPVPAQPLGALLGGSMHRTRALHPSPSRGAGQEGMLSPKAAVQQRCTSFPQPQKPPSLQPRHIHHRASATSRPAAGRFI